MAVDPAEWIIAICAILSLLIGWIWTLSSLKGDIRELRGEVKAQNGYMQRLERQQARFEVAILGKGFRTLSEQQFLKDTDTDG